MRGERVLTNDKRVKTLYLHCEIHRGLDAYPKGEQSALVETALLQYWKLNPKLPNGQVIELNITMQTPKEKEDVVFCGVTGCRQKAVTSASYRGKAYSLCGHHVKVYSDVKDWAFLIEKGGGKQ